MKGLIPFDVWNVSTKEEAVTRKLVETNNALENFNRQLNSSFSASRPSIYQFVEVVVIFLG